MLMIVDKQNEMIPAMVWEDVKQLQGVEDRYVPFSALKGQPGEPDVLDAQTLLTSRRIIEGSDAITPLTAFTALSKLVVVPRDGKAAYELALVVFENEDGSKSLGMEKTPSPDDLQFHFFIHNQSSRKSKIFDSSQSFRKTAIASINDLTIESYAGTHNARPRDIEQSLSDGGVIEGLIIAGLHAGVSTLHVFNLGVGEFTVRQTSWKNNDDVGVHEFPKPIAWVSASKLIDGYDKFENCARSQVLIKQLELHRDQWTPAYEEGLVNVL